jgi:hypothetical protein
MPLMARHKLATAQQLSLGLREQLDAQARAGRIQALVDAPLQAAQTSLQLRLLTVYRKAPTGAAVRPRR